MTTNSTALDTTAEAKAAAFLTLVKSWMKHDGGRDDALWTELIASMNANRLSNRKLF